MEVFEGVWKFLHNKRLIPVFLIIAFTIQIYKGYFRLFPAYWKAMVFSKKKIMLWASAALVVFGAAFLLDEPVTKAAQNASGKFAELLWNFGGTKGRSFWVFFTVAYLLFFFTRVRDFIFGAGVAALLNGVLTTLLKHTVLRARPETGLGPHSLFNFQHFASDHREFQSFPSGDVAITAGAFFFLWLVFRKRAWSILLFLTPFMTAFARMHWHRHWFSDTAAAMIFGMCFAFFVWRYEQFRMNKPAHG